MYIKFKAEISLFSIYISKSLILRVFKFVIDDSFPRFAEQIPNVTVSVGRDALMACVVDNLRGFKVGKGGSVMDCFRKDYWIAQTTRDFV